ncbi:MAG: PQQ-like beta-propeller repeat protein [Bacteroidales bacterium]|nr:PQQ-like beta-propeller repeat protein [Bacteroidales bacterium]
MYRITFLCLMAASFTLSCQQRSSNNSLLAGDIQSEEDLFEAMESNTQWPSYRGFYASGYIKDAQLPDSFNIETGHNVKWNIEIPGLGLSCPSIWDDMVFITTAVSEDDKEGYLTGMYGDIEPVADSSLHTWKLYRIERKSGKIVWERDLHEGIPKVKRHPKSSHANTTAATDGRHVVVFIGSEGLYCYNVDGELLWKRDFGLIRSAWDKFEWAEWEFSSSPVIFRDKVIIQADALNQAFIAILDLATGETLWRQERDEISTWSTPNIYFDGDQPRIAVNGYKHTGAYDLETGEEIWKLNGGGDIPIPTPITWKDLVFFNSAHGRHAPLMAIRNDARGEIQYPDNDSVFDKAFAWFYDREASYINSVVVYDSLLYRFRWNGNLTCFNARTGERIYSESVHPYSFVASPVIAGDRLYLVAEEGTLYTVQVGKEFRVLKRIPLGEVSLVTPGISKDMIIFRTAGRLIAVGK